MRIFLNNIEIPISEDLEIQASLLSPLFNVNDGSYLFNFTVPGTDTLYRALGWKHRMNTPRPVDVSFRLEQGSIRMKATAIVTQCDFDSYEISVGIGKGNFNYLVKDLKLKDPDIDWGEIQPWYFTKRDSTPLYVNNTGSSEDYVNLTFPNVIVNGIGSFSSSERSYISAENLTYTIVISLNKSTLVGDMIIIGRVVSNGGIEDIGPVINEFVLPITDNIRFYEFDVNLNVGDFIYFSLDLWAGASINTNGITIKIFEKASNAITDSIYNTYPNNNYTFYPVFNDDLFNNLNNQLLKDHYANFTYVNWWDSEKFPLRWIGPDKNNVTVKLTNILMPFLYVGYVLKNIVEYFGYTIKDNFFENWEWCQLTLVNFYIQYSYCSSVNDININYPQLYPDDFFRLKNQLPDMLISDFMNSLAFITGCVIDVNINTKELSFKPVSPIIKTKKSIDWNSKYSHVLSKFDSLYNGFELKYESQNDSYISGNYKSLNFGNSDMNKYNYMGESSVVPTLDPNLNDIYFNSDEKRYLIYTMISSLNRLGWDEYSKNFKFDIIQNYIDSRLNNLFTLSSKLVPLMRNDNGNISNYDDTPWLIPVTKQQGKFKFAYETLDAVQMPGILFYRGLQYYVEGKLYPMGDNFYKKLDGTDVYGCALSLRLDDKGGVLERWQYFLDFILACRQLEIFKDLDEIDIVKLAFDKYIMIEGKLVMLSEVKFKLSAIGVDVDEIWGFC